MEKKGRTTRRQRGKWRSEKKLDKTMVKRKAELSSSVRPKAEEVSLGVGPTEVLVGVERRVTVDQPTVDGNPIGVVANQVAEGAVDVAVREAQGIDWFWLLLKRAGYEVW